jgi:hypothetical protein
MTSFQDPRGPARWIAPIAIVVLIAGLSAAWWGSRLPRPSRPPVPPDVNLDPAEGVIHDALRQAGADSAAIKMRWVDEVPGFDLAGLEPRRREIFIRFANAERCTCGCGYTLAACRVYDSTCEVSAPRVQALLDSVRAGSIKSVAGIRKPPA